MKSQDDHSCGLGQWRPEFLQKFTTIKYFMIVYGLLGTIQGMSFVYFIATLTTLEKRFQIRSEVTGILMSGNEMSQIFLSIILAYRGGKGNRPVWIAWGVLFSSLSCFILALPHFIYGPGPNALALTEEFFDFKLLNSTLTPKEDVNLMLCSLNRTEDEGCKEETGEKPLLSLGLIFFSQFVLGIGTTLCVTLGTPYLDDNSNKKNTPMLLGLIMALRISGPGVGFVLGFFCLSLYVNPSLHPIIERTDPRWIGAWWLGWIVLGSVMTIFSFLIASFPRQLRMKKKTRQATKRLYESVASDNLNPSTTNTKTPEYEMTLIKHRKTENETKVGVLKGGPAPLPTLLVVRTLVVRMVELPDFKNALKRVCGNSLVICNIFTGVFYILGSSGYINYYTKYAETQFHQSAAVSSMITGVSTVTSMIVGLITAGYIISKFKPKESYLLLFNIFIAAVYMAGQLFFMFTGCDEDTLQGNLTDDGMFDPNLLCNANCSCDSIGYSPVCFEKMNQTFFSACHAGCSQIYDSAKRTYNNCTCLPDATDVVKQGPCPADCMGKFFLFVAIQCIIHFISCSGKITTILISYRCVEPRDKPLTQGVALFTISLLAFIPGPIVYGKVIDGTCQIWDNHCGNRGNCWVYSKIDFRKRLNLTGLSFTFLAFLFDIIVWYLGRNIKLYEETTPKEKT